MPKTKLTEDPKGWIPVLKGNVYCSPRCGGRCKHSDFLKVTEMAKALALELGSGWKPRVWENLGWHASAEHRTVNAAVHPNVYNGKVESHTLYFNDAVPQVCISSRDTDPPMTPRQLVATGIAQAKENAAHTFRAAMELERNSKVPSVVDTLLNMTKGEVDPKAVARARRAAEAVRRKIGVTPKLT